MKLKNLFALVLALALALTMFVGCTPKDDEKNESNVSNESSETSSEDVTSEEPVPTATIEDVHTAVKELLGENYIPKMAFDEQILSEQVKLTPDMYEDVIAEAQ